MAARRGAMSQRFLHGLCLSRQSSLQVAATRARLHASSRCTHRARSKHENIGRELQQRKRRLVRRDGLDERPAAALQPTPR